MCHPPRERIIADDSSALDWALEDGNVPHVEGGHEAAEDGQQPSRHELVSAGPARPHHACQADSHNQGHRCGGLV